MRRPTTDERLEQDVQRAVIACYKDFGCEVARFSERRTGYTRLMPGWPDLMIFCARKAMLWGHETKRAKGGRQSAEQRTVQGWFEGCKHAYVIGGVEAALVHMQAIGLVA